MSWHSTNASGCGRGWGGEGTEKGWIWAAIGLATGSGGRPQIATACTAYVWLRSTLELMLVMYVFAPARFMLHVRMLRLTAWAYCARVPFCGSCLSTRKKRSKNI